MDLIYCKIDRKYPEFLVCWYSIIDTMYQQTELFEVSEVFYNIKTSLAPWNTLSVSGTQKR